MSHRMYSLVNSVLRRRKPFQSKLSNLVCIAIGVAISTTSLWSNTDRKVWHMSTGEAFSAVLVEYQPETQIVILSTDEKNERTFHKEDLSALDQQWLVEYSNMMENSQELLKSLGGSLISSETSGAYPTPFYIYRPSTVEDESLAPLMILFHPGGKGARYILRHIEAAEECGLSLLALDIFRNTKDDTALEDELTERFTEVLDYIKRKILFDSSRMYLGGTSGGAWRSYHYAAWFKEQWAGIYANGGWLGGKEYASLNYPPLRVAMVNGHQDNAANRWIKHDSTILEGLGGVVKTFAFEGGHQVPPVSAQIKAFRWLMSLEEGED